MTGTTTRALGTLAGVALAATGCSLGAGSAYVGEWRPRAVVDYQVCVEDALGRCAETREVVTEHAARRFWGIHMNLFALGPSMTADERGTTSSFRGESSLEYLRGRGRVAWGIRASFLFDAADGRTLVSTPFTGLGHLSISERLSVYGGLGLSPYNQLQTGSTDTTVMLGGSTALMGRAVAGAHVVLYKTHGSTRTVLSFEADTLIGRIDGAGYRTSALTSSLGFFF